MMRFKEFLKEDVIPISELIKKQCAPFLEQARGRFLFRGIKDLSYHDATGKIDIDGDEVEYFKRSVRKNRKALTMEPRIHKLIDDWFEEKFDIRPRSTSMFCVTEKAINTAKDYGTVCAVFPIGHFEVCWSEKVEDLYNEVDMWAPKIQSLGLDREMRELNYEVGHVDEALSSKSEIMVMCDEYIAIPCSNKTMIDKIFKALK